MLLSKRIPSMQALIIFEAASRHQSFTGAATELGSTQSAVSQQIKALEQHLEVLLFKRVYRGVLLTEKGNLLYDAVKGGFQQISTCLDGLQKTRLRETINVATDFAFAAYWLLPRLPLFRELHPKIDVRIITSQGKYDFIKDDIDVSIVFSPCDLIDLSAHKLFDEEIFPVCSPGFLETNSPIKSHKRLAELPLLKLGTDAEQGWLDWRSFFTGRRSQVSPSEPVLTFNNYTYVIQAAIAGQGVGIGWKTLVDDLLESRLLVGLKQFSLRSKGGYYVVEPNPLEQLNAKQCFIDWLLSENSEN